MTKVTRFAFATTLCCSLFVTGLRAEEFSALTYNYYSQDAAAVSPSDLAANDIVEFNYAGHEQKNNGHKSKGKGKGKGKGGGGLFAGFIAVGGAYNVDNPTSRMNGPMTFNDREDIGVNQLYLSLGRDADTGGCGWDFGGRVDVLYGTDYIFTQSAGLETKDDGDNALNGVTSNKRWFNQYGLALPQAYGEVAYNNVSLKVGHFYTIMGYEVVAATGNFFYSHAYTMQYGEPFTHTGGLVTASAGQMTGYAGVVNGWDKTDAVSDKMAFLSGATYTDACDRYSLTATFIAGEEDGIAAAAITPTPRYLASLVFVYNVNCKVQSVMQCDMGWQEDVFGPGVDAEWYGFNSYLFYTLNDCWKVGMRSEWFRDDDGARLSAAPIRAGGPGGIVGMLPGGPSDLAGNYYQVTLGANYTPRENIMIRPEVRWDWSDGTVAAPFDDFTSDSQMTLSMDGIVTF
jgi:hypothetical protein